MLGNMLVESQSMGFVPIGPLDQFLGWMAALVIVSPLWLIFVFAAYAIGRRRLVLRDFFVFITIEAAALGLAIYVDSKTWPSERPPRPRMFTKFTSSSADSTCGFCADRTPHAKSLC